MRRCPIRRNDPDQRERVGPRQRRPRSRRAAIGASVLMAATVAWGPPGALFPEPFVVEHHLVQTDADGTRFATEPVTDYYGGSWLISVRPDGSRLIVDFARRELTEVRPAVGTYWTASFERIGELAARLARSEWRGTRRATDEVDETGHRVAAGGARAPELVVEELPAAGTPGLVRAGAASVSGPGSPTPLVRVRVVERQRSAEPDVGLEVWLDPSVRLAASALTALAAFDEAIGATAARREARPSDDVARQLAAARAHAGGALPVRTARALPGRTGATGRLEDVATRVERLDELPRELVTIPEGLRRVAHPMEAAAAFLEADAERDRAMAGGGER